MSGALNELANRAIRSGVRDVTHSPLYPAFRLAFVREYGREPRQRECWGGTLHELYDFANAPDTY